MAPKIESLTQFSIMSFSHCCSAESIESPTSSPPDVNQGEGLMIPAGLGVEAVLVELTVTFVNWPVMLPKRIADMGRRTPDDFYDQT